MGVYRGIWGVYRELWGYIGGIWGAMGSYAYKLGDLGREGLFMEAI
jgi:hypothetical protein